MKRFLAIYMGTAYARSSAEWTSWTRTSARPAQAQGMKACMEW